MTFLVLVFFYSSFRKRSETSRALQYIHHVRSVVHIVLRNFVSTSEGSCIMSLISGVWVFSFLSTQTPVNNTHYKVPSYQSSCLRASVTPLFANWLLFLGSSSTIPWPGDQLPSSSRSCSSFRSSPVPVLNPVPYAAHLESPMITRPVHLVTHYNTLP